MEEDSVDRLWLVVRSLKKPEGKYVRTYSTDDKNRITKSKSLM